MCSRKNAGIDAQSESEHQCKGEKWERKRGPESERKRLRK